MSALHTLIESEDDGRRHVYRVSDAYRDGDSEGNESADREELTRGGFEAELRRLVRRAHRSGTPVEGCDAQFPGEETPDCTIEIMELK